MPAIERRRCPPEFQERIDRMLGKNRYGGPLWRISWGQTETFTAGGYWPHDGYLGYRPLMKSNGAMDGDGDPYWMVEEWHPPEEYGSQREGFYVERNDLGVPQRVYKPYVPGSPAMYYFENRDEYTGLQTLGEFPYKGRYEVAFRLVSSEHRSGREVQICYQLDGFLFAWLLPMLVHLQRLKMSDRMEMAKRRTSLDEKAFDTNFADAVKSAQLSPAASMKRSQMIHDRELMMRQQMSMFLKKYGRPRPGIHQGKFRS